MGLDGSQILKLINEAQSKNSESPRHYLGMSGLGGKCARKIWLQWRWAFFDIPSPRLKRLFWRGHREEPEFVDYLRLIGFKVSDIDPLTNKQYEFVSSDGHCLGHCDGMAEGFGIKATAEFKTHNKSSFTTISRTNDIKASKFEHYAQTQRYMHEMGLKHGIYGAVNKDNDALHFEVIKRDKKVILWTQDREKELINAEKVPDRISNNPTFFICRMCGGNSVCHGNAKWSATCRTCTAGAMLTEGRWGCQKTKKARSLNEQLKGCEDYSNL